MKKEKTIEFLCAPHISHHKTVWKFNELRKILVDDEHKNATDLIFLIKNAFSSLFHQFIHFTWFSQHLVMFSSYSSSSSSLHGLIIEMWTEWMNERTEPNKPKPYRKPIFVNWKLFHCLKRKLDYKTQCLNAMLQFKVHLKSENYKLK